MTGNGYFSKVDTKHAALSSEPVSIIFIEFRRGRHITFVSEHDFVLAEKYMVRVWAGFRSNTKSDTFDRLSLENFTCGNAHIASELD